MESFHGPSSIPRRRRVCLWHLPSCQDHCRGAAAMLAAVALDGYGPVPVKAGLRPPNRAVPVLKCPVPPVLPATGVELAFDTGRASPDSAKTHRPLQGLRQSEHRADYTAHPLQICLIDPNSGASSPDWVTGTTLLLTCRDSRTQTVCTTAGNTGISRLNWPTDPVEALGSCRVPIHIRYHGNPESSRAHRLLGTITVATNAPAAPGDNQRQAVRQSSEGLFRRNAGWSLPVLADRITT